VLELGGSEEHWRGSLGGRSGWLGGALEHCWSCCLLRGSLGVDVDWVCGRSGLAGQSRSSSSSSSSREVEVALRPHSYVAAAGMGMVL
jgi:hypothetical protein